MKGKSTARMIDAYLVRVPPAQRAALQALRSHIRAAVPNAEEGISYGVPAFLVNGRAVAGFSAAKQHCSYYPMSGAVITALADDLARYETSKGAIRFTAERPLSATLVKKLVRARLKELQT
jgi:uncharacterized protein YdhG (YjbR/CyaY superfamily)